MFNRYSIVVLAVAVLFCSVVVKADPNAACTEAKSMEFGITADYFTKYIWRGQNLNDQSVFQPSIYLSQCGFTGTVWGNLDLTDKNGSRDEFTEVDLSLDYSNTIPNVDWLGYSVGVLYYKFPNTEFASTTEVYGGLSLPTVPLSPFFKVYRDVDEVMGTYVQLGVGQTFEKIQKWSEECYCDVELGASIGWANGQYNRGYFTGTDTLPAAQGDGLNDLTLTAALPLCLGNNWTLKPSLNYSMMLSDTVRDATEKSDNLWGGLSLTKTF